MKNLTIKIRIIALCALALIGQNTFAMQGYGSISAQAQPKPSAPPLKSPKLPQGGYIRRAASPSLITSTGTVAYDYLGRPIQRGTEYVLGSAYGAMAGAARKVYNVGANFGSYISGGISRGVRHWFANDQLLLEAAIALPVLEQMVSELERLISQPNVNNTNNILLSLLSLNSQALQLQDIHWQNNQDPYIQETLDYLQPKITKETLNNLQVEAYTAKEPNQFLYIIYTNIANLTDMTSVQRGNMGARNIRVQPNIANLKGLLADNKAYRKTYAARLGKEWSSAVRGAAAIGAAGAAYWLKNYFSGGQ